MAISRSLMNRQLQANGGIMQVAPREKFGLGSSLKKFVRKIIPNEVAEVATKAAPFVAPFNPAVAAAMAGIGSFDQTGSISDAFKRGALTYGGGQLARFAGGAGFQGNPFAADGGAFRGGLQGFKSGFSSPLGNQTGFKLGKPVEAVEGVGLDMQTGGADGVGIIKDGSGINTTVPLKKPVQGGIDLTTGGADAFGIIQDTVVDKTTVAKEPGFLKNLFDGVSNQDYGKIAKTIGDGAKKFGKAMFTNKDGSIDKAAVLGAMTFAASYAEARALAAETGVDDDLTEDEYNELIRQEKKDEYAGYLTNFYGGRKEGGRIGFESGANEIIKTKLLEDIMPDTGSDLQIVIMTEDGPKLISKEDYEALSPSMLMDTSTGFGINIKRVDEAKGGRIGFKKGSPEKSSEIGIMSIDVEAGDDENDMDNLMAGITFSSAEKSYLFRKLAGQGGASRSYTMPNLYKILSNPNKFPTDAAILKEIAIMGMKKDGGRIELKEGSKDIELEELLETSSVIPEDPNDPRNMTTEQIISIIKSGRSTPEMFEELMLRGYTGVDSIMLEDMPDSSKAFTFRPDGETGIMEDFLFKLRESNPDSYGKYTRPRPFQPIDAPKFKAKGGRINFAGGANRVSELLVLRDGILAKDPDADVSSIDAEIFQLTGKVFKSIGGIGDVPTGKIRQNSAGVIERDYRDEGGFVPVGVKERADDVPAMLSKNEFVMTADAVRGIGGGDVEKGSKKLYKTMKQAEKVGKA